MICAHCDDPFSYDASKGRLPKYCEPCSRKITRRGRASAKLPERHASWQYSQPREFLDWLRRPSFDLTNTEGVQT
jgi:hypothetical protein